MAPIFKARIAGTRSEVHPRLSRNTFAATRELMCNFPTGWPVWAASAAHQGRVAVVVVGVTAHRGARESRVQGEAPQVMSFQDVCVRR